LGEGGVQRHHENQKKSGENSSDLFDKAKKERTRKAIAKKERRTKVRRVDETHASKNRLQTRRNIAPFFGGFERGEGKGTLARS